MSEFYDIVPLSPMRKVIAARMMEARRTIPHFRLTSTLDVDALLELRRALREADPSVPFSLNDLLIKACAGALVEVPAVNIQWAEEGIHQYRTADISVVIALEGGGLSTPIIRGAESKSIARISQEVRALSARAAQNALKMHDIIGGTFSISNLGMYGVDSFDAIINPPQCAILAVGAAKPRVLVSGEGERHVGMAMTVTLSCDHRVIDGATGAQFLAALRERIEAPQRLAECMHDPATGRA